MNLLWQQIANTTVSRILCSTNMDGIVLDCEHGYFNPETLVNCIEIIKLAGKKCFMRLKNNERLIQLAYDNKCDGVIIADCYRYSHIKPGIGLVRSNFWGRHDILRSDMLIIGQVEDIEMIDRLEDYTGETYDYLMIGPYDLSNSIGDVENFQNENYLNAIKKFEKIIPLRKRGIHLVKDIPSQVEKYKDYGLKCWSLDSLMILDSIKEIDKHVK